MIKFPTTRHILIVLVIIFITIGCDKSNDATSNTCFLANAKTVQVDGSVDELVLTFDSDNKVIKTEAVNDGYTYQYSYNSIGNVVKQTYDDGSLAFTYNNLNQVIKEEYYAGTTLSVIIENEFNSFDQIIKRKHYNVTNNVASEDYYNTLEYATPDTKNFLRMTKFSADGALISTVDYLYDDKKNPWNLGTGNLFSRLKNNIIKETLTKGTSIKVDTYTYTYMENGYPSAVTYSDSAGSLLTETYTYNCK